MAGRNVAEDGDSGTGKAETYTHGGVASWILSSRFPEVNRAYGMKLSLCRRGQPQEWPRQHIRLGRYRYRLRFGLARSSWP